MNKEIRTGLNNNEFLLHYQPIFDLAGERIIGAEALIRWISPIKGIVAPNLFIPLAEENGFIVELGNWVLKEAIQQQIKFKESGMDISISINVATKQLLNHDFEYT